MEKKFIHSSKELIEYFSSNNITLENFRNNKIVADPKKIEDFIVPCEDKKTVFLPYSGEFGTAIIKYMLRFHYHTSRYKVACIPRGYECFFPDAKEFIYDYPSPYPRWENYKGEGWVLNDDKKSIVVDSFTRKYHGNGKEERVLRYFFWKQRSNVNLKNEFQEFIKTTYDKDATIKQINLFNTNDPVTNAPIQSVAKIPFKNEKKYGIKVDVVFANRKLDGDKRTFKKWPEIVKYLQSKGLIVGGIGKPETSFTDMNIINNFDYENHNDATIEMLSNAKYYIGTDTGVTHWAMNFSHLKSILFRINDGTYDWIYAYRGKNTKVIRSMRESVEKFNDEKILYKHIDEFFV